jgi:hypothetical protein
MKKLVLLFTGLLIGLTTVSAAETTTANKGERLEITKRYREMQPILFVERGVEFLVFPDGSFDFNTNYGNQAYNSRPYARRSSVNVTYGAPGRRVQYSAPRNSGVLITHDYDGKVRRIGNIFINYDGYGRIKRAGTVYVKYGKHGFLKQVGGLKLKYNPWGKLIKMSGFVNHSNQSCGLCGIDSCSGNHFDQHDQDDWYDDNNDDDDDQYYYRSNKNKKKGRNKKNKY